MGNFTKAIWSANAAIHMHNTRKIREALEAQNAANGIVTPSQVAAQQRAIARQARADAKAAAHCRACSTCSSNGISARRIGLVFLALCTAGISLLASPMSGRCPQCNHHKLWNKHDPWS